MAQHPIVHSIEAQDWIDRAAAPVAEPVRALLARTPTLEGALTGRWLGHPLHPVITDVPVGAWSAAQVLDLLDVWGGRTELRAGADAAHAIGLAGALLAAVAGIADFSHTRTQRRKVAFVHGVTNVVVAGLYAASLYSRSRGARRAGLALSTAGFGLLMFSSWLGGELTYALGTRVDRSQTQEEQGGGDLGEARITEAGPTLPGW